MSTIDCIDFVCYVTVVVITIVSIILELVRYALEEAKPNNFEYMFVLAQTFRMSEEGSEGMHLDEREAST